MSPRALRVPHPGRDNELDQSWHLTSTLPGVRFVDGQVEESGNGAVAGALQGRYLSVERDTTTGTTRLECTADGAPNAWGRSGIAPAGFAGSSHVAVRVTDLVDVTATCDDGRSPGYTARTTTPPPPSRAGSPGPRR